jgi:hypothetical protein
LLELREVSEGARQQEKGREDKKGGQPDGPRAAPSEACSDRSAAASPPTTIIPLPAYERPVARSPSPCRRLFQLNSCRRSHSPGADKRVARPFDRIPARHSFAPSSRSSRGRLRSAADGQATRARWHDPPARLGRPAGSRSEAASWATGVLAARAAAAV